MNCPKCNKQGELGFVHDALMINPGPEGPVNIIGCTECGWARAAVYNSGIHRFVQLKDCLSAGTRKMAEKIRSFQDDQ